MDRKPYPAEKAAAGEIILQHAVSPRIFLSGLIMAFVLVIMAMTFR